MTPVHNPHPPGSAEAAEYDAILARLGTDRRAVHSTPERLAYADEHRVSADEHARSLSAAGVLFGPDNSQFQGAVDWSAIAAAGCRIFGYKVSEGRTYADPQHARSKAAVAALQRAGRGVGVAYHYLFGSAEYAANPSLWGAQADFFCSLVDPAVVHVVDVEAAQPAPGLGVDRWCAAYFRHFPTKTLLVYANHSLYTVRSHVAGGAPSGTVETWHAGIGDGFYTAAKGSLSAEWAATGSLHDTMQSLGFPPARLWQFTDHAVVPGVAGTCDGNAFLGTLTELRALATGATDDMSQADVDAVNAHTDAAIAKVGALLHNQQIFADKAAPPDGRDLSFGLALHYIYQATAGGLVTDADLAGALATLRTGVVNDVVAKLPTVGGSGGVDTDALKAVVGEVFDDHIGRVGLAVQPGT